MQLCSSSSLMASAAGVGRVLPRSSALSSTNSAFFRTNEMRMVSSFSVSSERRVPLLSVRRRGGGRRVGECKCLFGLGVPELAVIAGVAALVFGPKKLPEIGRSIGKTVKSFQEVGRFFFRQKLLRILGFLIFLANCAFNLFLPKLALIF